jgi:hypothetical protein
MTDTPVPGARRDPPAAAGPKLRRCLRCRDPFESAWSGERICAPCKRSSGWRQGTGIPTDPGRYGPRRH